MSSEIHKKLSLSELENKCREFIDSGSSGSGDSAHDTAHVTRVVKNAKLILKSEDADPEVVVAAAWLHDCVIVPKNHPDREKASSMAAEKAADFLTGIEFPSQKIQPVKHAIEAHSFSSGIKTESIEAKIVQDADRLDAIGAVGIARCFMVGGKLDRAFYNPDDPLCEKRNPDDVTWTVDHFYEKLFKLPEMMHTSAAIEEAESRIRFMEEYLHQLKREV